MQKSLPSQHAFFAPLKKTAMENGADELTSGCSFFHPISNGRIEFGSPPQCNHCTACNIFLRLDLILPVIDESSSQLANRPQKKMIGHWMDLTDTNRSKEIPIRRIHCFLFSSNENTRPLNLRRHPCTFATTKLH